MFIQIHTYLHVMFIYSLWITELNTLMSMFESAWIFQIHYDIDCADFICIVTCMVLSLAVELLALYLCVRGLLFYTFYMHVLGARCSAVGWGTTLQVWS